jgi:hypothetical protein
MEENFKPIKYSLIKSEIKKVKQYFPCEVKFIHVFLVNDTTCLSFINDDNQNVTQKVMAVYLSKEVTIYDYLLSKFLAIPSFVNKLEENVIYVHKADFSTNIPNYLNYEVFRSLRIAYNKQNPLSVKDLSYKLSVNHSIIYNIENRIPVSYSFDSIFKYAFFFKKNIFKLLSKRFGEQLLGIFLIDLIQRNVITEKTADVILKDFHDN